MSAWDLLLRSWGNSGALANARSAVGRHKRAEWVAEGLTRRLDGPHPRAGQDRRLSTQPPTPIATAAATPLPISHGAGDWSPSSRLSA